MTRKGKKRAPRQQEQQEPLGSQKQPQEFSNVQEQPFVSKQQQKQWQQPSTLQQPADPQQQQHVDLQQQQPVDLQQQQHYSFVLQQHQKPTSSQQQQQPAVLQHQQQQSFDSQQTQWQQRPDLESQPVLQRQRPYAALQQQQHAVPQRQQQYAVLQHPDILQQQQQHATPQQQQRPYSAPQQQQRQSASRQQQRPSSAPQQQQRPSASQQQQRPSSASQEQRRSLALNGQRRSLAPREQRPFARQQQEQQQQQPLASQQQQQPLASQQQQQPLASQQQQPVASQQQQHTFFPQKQLRSPPIQQQHQQSTSQQHQPLTSQQHQQKHQPSTSQQQRQLEIIPKQRKETAVSSGRSKFKLPNDLRQIYVNQIPRNAGGGTRGKKIQVFTNMFRIKVGKDFPDSIIHYDVVLTPNATKSLFPLVFEQYRMRHFPDRFPGFDRRKNAYSRDELPFGEQSEEDEITVLDPEKQQERVYKIYMKKVAVLDMSWLKDPSGLTDSEEEENCIQALATIFHYGPAYRFTPVGRSLYQKPQPGREVRLSDGYDLWTGVFQSVLVRKRAYLNVDVAYKAFPKEQPVIDLLKDLCKHPRDKEPLPYIQPENIKKNKEKLTKSLKGLKIRYELPRQPSTRRIYPVNDLSECPRKNKFHLKDNTLCTVEEYYLNYKNYRIQFPELPCLWVGRPDKKIHLPMELCTIVGGQVTQKKLTETQTSQMISYTAVNAEKRKENITAAFASLKLSEQPTLMKEFHLSVEGEFEKVPARILDAPLLQYSNTEVKVFRGEWRSQQFYMPCDLPDNSWTIINLDKFVKDRDLYHLQEVLRKEAKNVNMTIGKALTPFTNETLQRDTLDNIIKCFEGKKRQHLKLVIVIIPNINNAYSKVKQTAELTVSDGVLTQCLKQNTLSKLNTSTVTNILLKINSKLNGVNHILAPTCRPRCLSGPCMLVGADVTHPPSEDKSRPSIAAVVASHDLNPFQYNKKIDLQPSGEEQILNLKEIMYSQLKYFKQETNSVPEKIIFYRDGVGDGQLPEIMHFELTAIREAVAKFTGSSEKTIPITFIVVQKRHHIRLFPTDNNSDKNFNVLPGTVVDTEITHPQQIDYYLVSHASIKGTARPTRYRCLCNESNLSEDELQQLTYYLCHVYARCTRTVSYPAPTYYAHWAAYRARVWLNDIHSEDLMEEQRIKMNTQMLANPMHFV